MKNSINSVSFNKHYKTAKPLINTQQGLLTCLWLVTDHIWSNRFNRWRQNNILHSGTNLLRNFAMDIDDYTEKSVKG